MEQIIQPQDARRWPVVTFGCWATPSGRSDNDRSRGGKCGDVAGKRQNSREEEVKLDGWMWHSSTFIHGNPIINTITMTTEMSDIEEVLTLTWITFFS